jgi:hypothetical protein
MMDNNILNKISTPLTNQVSSIQVNALNSLLSASRLSGMANMAVRSPGAYNVDEFYADLKKGIFNEVATRTKISAERRTLQKAYVDRMLSILNPAPASGITLSIGGATGSDLSRTDVSSITRAHINQLRNELNAAAAAYTDNMSKYHLQDLVARIKEAMESK